MATIYVGLNAINVLRALGVYDDICARAIETDVANATDSSHPAQRTGDMRGWFRYYSGMGDHALLSDVRPTPLGSARALTTLSAVRRRRTDLAGRAPRVCCWRLGGWC